MLSFVKKRRALFLIWTSLSRVPLIPSAPPILPLGFCSLDALFLNWNCCKRLYSKFYNLCDTKVTSISKPDLVIVEDSNAGWQFFSDFFSKYDESCISAQGKSNIHWELLHQTYSTALVIVDGTAFGPEIERVLSLKKLNDKNLIIYLPESFEWMTLKSGLLKEGRIHDILESPYDHIESKNFFSWERFLQRYWLTKRAVHICNTFRE